MHVSVRVLPRGIISGIILTLFDWLNIFAAFWFHFMALEVNVIYRRDPCNEMCHQLQPTKTKVSLY